jgi:hypothetical protein
MLTQQELIDRLNQLTLRYNLTWFDIKYDADKAINKINNFLGTKYPKISEYMVSPNSTYSITTSKEVMVGDELVEQNTEYEIIKEEYFHSVIIPYIAMEVLARDEEFTTIYTKYNSELEDGLYNMFQKEFNKVPFEFRQNPDQGVFFEMDSALGKIQHNDRHNNVPTFKFKIHYIPNQSDLALPSTFVQDTKAYNYGEEATILFWPESTQVYSTDYNKVYTFVGWSRERNVNQAVYTVTNVTPVIMKESLNLYGVWTPASTLSVGTTGERILTINSVHRQSMQRLIIPEFVNGVRPLTIPQSFVSSNQVVPGDLLNYIALGTSIRVLNTNSFNNFQGTEIILNEGLETIRAFSFANTPNLHEIIIPASVTTIETNAFPVISGKHLIIKTRVLEANVPVGWQADWYAPSTSNYTVEIIWGYNG